ncbi:hypothetical protein [Kangiella sp. TOML190]|uniref:hypothetical protein n=1 Tax=Kangiella sp. TOML190 TaxID=2931351 RepID=UPI00203E2461|nr:hypothetical protein [Kangiella sp. TOML190]
MKSEYLIPGLLAIALAVIFPIYLIYEALSIVWGDWNQIANSMIQFGASDLAFLLIGVLSIIVYLGFKKILNDQLNFKALDVPLLIIIAISAVFYLGFFLFAVVFSVGTYDLFSDGSWLATFIVGFTFVCFILFGILDILIGAIILRHHKKLPSLLMVSAVVSIIQGVFEISLIFAEATLITFPMYLIVLAVYFLRPPETIEVV